MKKTDKKAFTLIELLVVVAVIGILVLLGAPRFTSYVQDAQLTRIQQDIKVMEQEVGAVLINNDDDFNSWENNSKNFNQLIQENKLLERKGPVAKGGEPIDGPYKVIPEKYKNKINTKLKGTFYANSGGKVYYEHVKSLSGISTGPEKELVYSDEEIEDLIEKGYIPIATADELNNVRSATLETYGEGTKWKQEYTGGLNKQYVQVANIDLSKYSAEGWSPIGTNYSSNFTGIYDGGNYVVTGLVVNGEGKINQGLFGYTQGATIRNVGLIDNKVTGKDRVGGLVGSANNSTIENSYATGSVTGKDYVGGLVGNASYSMIENSYATGSVKGANRVGGLVGMASGSTIKDSYATGSVEGADEVGGLVGRAYSSTNIINSYATGSVTGSSDVGGLVGEAYNGATISNSYATGSVTGSGDHVGGLVGGAIYESTKITDSYATGSVTGTNEVGGLVGRAYFEITIENSYATGSVTGESNVGGLAGEASYSSTISNSYATGSVTGSRDQVGGLVGWAQIRATISNSYAKGEVTGREEVGGLVGEASGSTEITNSYATGTVKGSGNNVGGLAGYAYNIATITNSYATGAVTGKRYVGGLVGRVNDRSTITNSYATGSVTGTGATVGGLVGSVYNSTTSNSYWDTKTTRQEESAGGEGKTTEEMKKSATYTDGDEGWNFDTVWEIDEGNDYPKLR